MAKLCHTRATPSCEAIERVLHADHREKPALEGPVERILQLFSAGHRPQVDECPHRIGGRNAATPHDRRLGQIGELMNDDAGQVPPALDRNGHIQSVRVKDAPEPARRAVRCSRTRSCRQDGGQ